MVNAYSGPLRSEPLAIELHNTVYAVGGEVLDGLGDALQARGWLGALTQRLPGDGAPPGRLPTAEELVELRAAVRTVLHAASERRPLDAGAIETINEACRRAPRSAEANLVSSGRVERGTCFHGASRADIIIGAFAEDAVNLVTSPLVQDLRACGAPGCVLMFLKDHPRREWCSQACGNRARQARHYLRTRLHKAP
jgi:predicted RNA-binding Zn ribbon-like protein